MFKFPDDKETMKILNLQVTNKERDAYLKISESEYSLYKEYIPKSVKRVVDLGCGLGRASIYLNSQLDNDPRFIFADYNEVSEKVKYGWNPQSSTYNSLRKTKEFAVLNGMINFSTLDLGVKDLSGIDNVDIIISVLAVGFHYPVEGYLSDFHRMIKDDGIIVLGIRPKEYGGKYDENSFSELFTTLSYSEDYVSLTKERILVLKKKVV
jgi:SAM-dependent methyltransferase